jgi:carbon storage regulator
MLVLTRRLGEAIVIGGDVRVTVLLTEGGKVRLGISAPHTTRVDRAEVAMRRTAEEMVLASAGPRTPVASPGS